LKHQFQTLFSKQTAKTVEMTKEISHYECKRCSTVLYPDTQDVFTQCRCGKVNVRGTKFFTHVGGDKAYLKTVHEGEMEKELPVYRIKQVMTGLYYSPVTYRSTGIKFTSRGRFYTNKPTLKWISPEDGECVVETYSLTLKR